jgi:hypothetical protein
VEYWEQKGYKIKLFSILLWHSKECEDDIASSWSEFDPGTPEEEVETYPEDFKIWFIDNKYEDMYEARFSPLEDDYWDEHEILFFFKDSVSIEQLHSINLLDATNKTEDYDGYKIREDGQIYMKREMELDVEMDWRASSDFLDSFYEDLKRRHCEEYSIPPDWIREVGIWG